MDVESDDYYVILVDEDVNESGIQVFNLDDIGPSESDTIKKECEYLLSEDAVEDTKDTDELKKIFGGGSLKSNLEEGAKDSIDLEALFGDVTSKRSLDKVKIESTELKAEFPISSDSENESTVHKKWENILEEYLHAIEQQEKTPPPPILEIPYEKISDEIYKCNYCEMLTLNDKLAIRHYRFKHGEKYHECLACSSSYRRHDALLAHENICSGKTAAVMRLAREAFIAKRKPAMSKNERRKMKLPCVTCNKFISRGNMNQHMKTHLGVRTVYPKRNKTFICDICQATFLRKRSIEAHVNAHFNRKPYECKTCGKGFYNSNILLGHKWIHIPRRFKCDLCERSYRKKVTLLNHIQSRHPDGLSGYLCTKCGKQIANKNEWDDHILIHKVMQYPCSDCEKTFTNITSLDGHLKRNHGKQILTRQKFLKKLPQLKEVPGLLFDVVTN